MGCRSRATWKTFLRGYLRCGILSFGLASARCGTCGHDFLVARRWATTKSVQGSRCLPLMQRPPHGADRRPSGRSRHPTGCRPTVGDFRAEEAALTLGGCAHPWRLRSPLAAALTLGGCAHPWRLRWFLAQRDRPEAVAALTNIFMREVERLVREAAGVASSPAAGDAPRIGAVSFLHRERLGTRAACPSACVRDGRRVLPDRDG